MREELTYQFIIKNNSEPKLDKEWLFSELFEENTLLVIKLARLLFQIF